MNIVIRELSKKDYRKAVRFAITGMHFNWYMDSRLLLWLYGTYFWYKELTRATQVIAAYVGDAFAGVLLAEVYGEKRVYASFWKSLYVRFFEFLQRAFSKSGAGLYEQTTEALLAAYRQTQTPDGEILFLGADPDSPVKGVGSALLAEFERRERGKIVYLHTDDACTYPFYEHRGFVRAGEEAIVLDMGNKQVPLTCFLYSKTIK